MAKHAESLDPIVHSFPATAEPAEPWMELNVTVAYQDLLTREWAWAVCDHTVRRVGTGTLRSTWWKMDFQEHPPLLTQAVQAAVQADAIIVALHAAKTLPDALCRWFDEWLTQCAQKESTTNNALIALIAATSQTASHLESTRAYLRNVADQGRWDFLPQEKLVVV